MDSNNQNMICWAFVNCAAYQATEIEIVKGNKIESGIKD